MGLTIWELSNMLVGWLTGYFGLFGLQRHHSEIPGRFYGGFVLVLLSLFFFCLAAFDSKEMETDLEEATETESEPEENKQKPCFPTMLGLGMAVTAGLLFGSTFDLPMDRASGDFSVHHGLLYCVLSHFVGMFLAASTSLLIYGIINGRSRSCCKVDFPSIPPGVIWGILSGIMWGMAQVAWFQADVELGLTVAFPIVASLPGIIALMIGFTFLREVQTYRSRILVALGMLLRVPGVLLIALSTS